MIIPGGNLNPKIVSKKINTIIGKIILTNIKYITLLSPQQFETNTDNNEIAKKKSNVFDITIKITKLNIVKKKVLGNFFSLFQGFLKDKKYINEVRVIIKTNKPFGNVAGWIPLFRIGGTLSNVKVDINKNIDTKTITKKTLNSSLKKKGKLLFALFLSRTLFMLRNVLN